MPFVVGNYESLIHINMSVTSTGVLGSDVLG